MNIKPISYAVLSTALLIGLTACLPGNLTASNAAIVASGTIDADIIRVAPELAGKIAVESAHKGERIAAGAPLFQLDDALLQAKSEEAAAQVHQAEAAVALAEQNLANAQLQYQLVLDASERQVTQPAAKNWLMAENKNFTLPNWYFEKSETLASVQTEVDAAQKALDDEQAALANVLKDASTKDFVEAELRIGRAQAAFVNADLTLTQANAGVGLEKTRLVDAAQKIYDEAETELNAAQKAYDAMLSSTAASDVLEARARVAAARARLENAQDTLNTLLTREDALPVAAARITIDVAKANLDQAQAALATARAAQHELEITLEKTTVTAPISGIILSNPVKSGETVAAGVTVFEIGNLDEVRLTVYVTEDQIGKVKLDQEATVTVDSYPGETFTGTVVYIADEAEFTPRNIQTSDSRSTTVYAVEIRLDNPDYKLKPGMPADASIALNE